MFPVIGIDGSGTIWVLPESRITSMDKLLHNITKMSNIESPLTVAKGDIFVYKVIALLMLIFKSRFHCLLTLLMSAVKKGNVMQFRKISAVLRPRVRTRNFSNEVGIRHYTKVQSI